MGHRLSVALIVLNAMGFLACLVLIAANSNQTTEVAIHLTRSIQPATRMFIVGAVFFIAAWELPSLIINGLNVRSVHKVLRFR